MRLLSSSGLPTSFSVGWLGFEDEDDDESENERWAEDQGRDPLAKIERVSSWDRPRLRWQIWLHSRTRPSVLQ